MKKNLCAVNIKPSHEKQLSTVITERASLCHVLTYSYAAVQSSS